MVNTTAKFRSAANPGSVRQVLAETRWKFMDCRLSRKFANHMCLSSKYADLRKAALPGFHAKNHVHQRCSDKRLLLPSILLVRNPVKRTGLACA